MLTAIRVGRLLLLNLALVCTGFGQMKAQLRNTDSEITVEATPEAPRLATFDSPGLPEWQNRSSESMIPFAEVGGVRVACKWKLNSEESRISEQQVIFVYESASPHLRLNWEWRGRKAYGPFEHQIRIENQDDKEIWIPMQDSLTFDWLIDPRANLRQVFVEKGANIPSVIGTHNVAIGEDFHWTGTSSTYGDIDERDPREIIPWTLVQKDDSAESGWYAGIEFSGRTRISLTREKGSLKAALGLNPDPSPFRTRLLPGEAFEVPVAFFGGFRDGPDGAGNVLRRWVRSTLGNPETWKNPDYPLVVNNSWGGGMEVNEQIAQGMIRDVASLGVEMFHIDAGWFRGVGDWYPNPQKFPNGLAYIADEAHKQGLRFGIWVDWTQAALDTEPGALNVHDPKVRDWLVTDLSPDWKPEEFKGQTIDLGVPAAHEHLQKEVKRIVEDYRLDMLEHDG